jgi:hypothetical protein
MVKILYAAGNRLGSHYQLKRFLNSIANKNYDVKIAAYKVSMGDLDIDYCLDALLNITNPDGPISFNGNYSYYHNEVKRFAPNLIISDFELYSSVLANELGIELWQVSPINLYYALNPEIKQAVGIHKNYSYLIESNHNRFEYTRYILNNSNRKFVLSHLCDCENPPELIPGFEWARPSFVLGEAKNNYSNVIILSRSNKKLIDEYKNKNSILFTNSFLELYNSMIVEDINSEDIYKNCLDNCKYFITDGTPTFLADAFYNCKYCFSVPRYDDIESIVSSYMNQYCKLGNMNSYGTPLPFKIKINDNIKFISEHLGK